MTAVTQRLDPALRHLAEARTDLTADRLQTYRESLNHRRREYAGTLDTTGVTIEESRANAVLVRIYRGGPTPAPTVIYCHSGAFVLGNLDVDHRQCVELAKRGQCTVISVDYRLAPNTPFPRRSTMRMWCSSGRPTMRPNFSSTSIGWRSRAAVREEHSRRGSYSARPRAVGPRIVFQLLHQPVLDDRPTPSEKEFQAAPGFDGPAVRMMWQHYLAGARASADAAPARCTELSSLPSTLITCSEVDPLRDEAIGYAQRLMSSGVATELHALPGTCHGFDAFLPDWEMSRVLFDIQGAALRRALHA